MLAHAAGGGALPAPPWLLSYIGAAAVLGTAAVLRSAWPTSRGLVAPDAPALPGPRAGPGHVVGLVLLAALIGAAVVGPDSNAANIAPVALRLWWVVLPISCLVLGDVMRWLSPFPAVVRILGQEQPPDAEVPTAPAWTAAAFLAVFGWFSLAYHRPGSPRAVAVLLAVYLVAAVAGAVRWGRAWAVTGEAFGGLSTAVARIGLRRPPGRAPAGTTALMVVWLGAVAFDACSSTPFWVDVISGSQGWGQTMLHTIGLVWVTAIVAGAFLLVVRIAERARDEPLATARLAAPLGIALVPLTVGVFIAHDLTLLLEEGQNLLALASDPLGKGWDLFGTFNHTIDYSIARAGWVRAAQLSALVVGHVAAVVLFHDIALGLLRRRAAMRSTWAMAVAVAASITGAVLLVLA